MQLHSKAILGTAAPSMPLAIPVHGIRASASATATLTPASDVLCHAHQSLVTGRTNQGVNGYASFGQYQHLVAQTPRPDSFCSQHGSTRKIA